MEHNGAAARPRRGDPGQESAITHGEGCRDDERRGEMGSRCREVEDEKTAADMVRWGAKRPPL